MLSLTARLLIGVSIVLGAFLGLTGYALDQAYQRSAKEAAQERLQGHIMTLIAAAQVKLDGSIFIPEFLPVVRFNQVNSGLYAKIINQLGDTLWASPSLADINFPVTQLNTNTETQFTLVQDSHGQPLFNLAYGVSWDTINKVHVYSINVAESLEAYDQEISRFRNLLWLWLGGVSLLLLAVQGIILRWSLKPLRRAAEEIVHIEQGSQASLQHVYPRELRTLTNNLNALMDSNKKHLTRHRNALSDLAHSLKTPLALIRGVSEQGSTDSKLSATVSEQVDKMQQIIDYQLQRAATSGRIPLSKPVAVEEVANKIINSLLKVYAEKNVNVNLSIEPECLFYGDQSDLYEMLGNLADNAFKWCHKKVVFDIQSIANTNHTSLLKIIVEDDGPGIEKDIVERIMERGVHSSKKEGTGIGLAIVNDIIDAYEGHLSIAQSPLGGAQFTVSIKQAN